MFMSFKLDKLEYNDELFVTNTVSFYRKEGNGHVVFSHGARIFGDLSLIPGGPHAYPYPDLGNFIHHRLAAGGWKGIT